jgi:hypothetical protein
VGALALAVAACSGVPSSSKPQVIGPGLGGNSLAPQPTNTPQKNAEPREIVQEFLRANISEPLDPRGPHEFLTPDEQRKWSDQGVTILSGSIDDAHVGLGVTGTTHAVAVQVKGTQVGSIGANGAYTAWPVGSGGEGTQWAPTYGLDPVNGQFRISDAPDGLVVYATEFAQFYRAVRLYFLDGAETRLVPDVRYTALQSPQAIATWALNQLIAGPRSELTNAVHNEIPPNQPSGRASVSINGLQVRVELPGSSRLDSDDKVRMAAQLLATLASQSPKTTMTITDGGVPVDIGNLGSSFTRADFARLSAPAAPGQAPHFFDQTPDPPAQWPLFYVDDQHRLVTGNGAPVSGPMGTPGRYGDLNSVAITGNRADSDYYVAATRGQGSGQTLWLGRTTVGLNTQVSAVPRGPLTRPSWLAGQSQVWVASGSKVYAVQYFPTSSSQAQTQAETQAVSVPLLPGNARIKALRLSPEGSRVAMIIEQGNASQLWIGSVVRNDNTQGTPSRIDQIEPVTPPAYRLTDVTWSDDSTLWVVGSGPQGGGVWSVNPDGALMKDQPLTGLPQPKLDSITAGVGVLPWSSAGGYVYQQNPDTESWEGPGRHTTHGNNPVYQDGYVD